jgi:hypothetical protein
VVLLADPHSELVMHACRRCCCGDEVVVAVAVAVAVAAM